MQFADTYIHRIPLHIDVGSGSALLVVGLGFVRAETTLDALLFGTEPEEFETMLDDFEAAKTLCNLVLERLDFVVFELEHKATLGANQVIVMIGGNLVAGLSIAKVSSVGETSLYKQLECAVDRRIANLLVFTAHVFEQVIRAHVPFARQKLLDNCLPLLSCIETILLQIVLPTSLLATWHFPRLFLPGSQ